MGEGSTTYRAAEGTRRNNIEFGALADGVSATFFINLHLDQCVDIYGFDFSPDYSPVVRALPRCDRIPPETRM
jgi:hypothetical protein